MSSFQINSYSTVSQANLQEQAQDPYVRINKRAIKKIKNYIENLPLHQEDSIYFPRRMTGLQRSFHISATGQAFIHLNRCYSKQDYLMGKGSFKTVKLCLDPATKKKFIAATSKFFFLSFLKATQEFEKLQAMQEHQGFVRLIDHVIYAKEGLIHEKTGQEAPFPKIKLILENCEGGTLESALYQKSIEKCNIKSLFHQMIEALAFMHKKGYLHRDLKTDNILLRNVEKSPNMYEAVIADLGDMVLEREADEQEVGTSWYQPPEYVRVVLEQGKYPVKNKKSDVWSMGCILHELLGNEWLFSLDDEEAFEELSCLSQKDFPEPQNKISPEHLVWEMMQFDPEKRISSEEALEKLANLDWPCF